MRLRPPRLPLVIPRGRDAIQSWISWATQPQLCWLRRRRLGKLPRRSRRHRVVRDSPVILVTSETRRIFILVRPDPNGIDSVQDAHGDPKRKLGHPIFEFFSICLILVAPGSNSRSNMLAILRFGFPPASNSLALLRIFWFRSSSTFFLPGSPLTPPL